MKIFYCIFLLIFLSVGNCFSQDSIPYVFHLNKLPPEGVLLDKGWKLQVGDNPEWANYNYDDHAWISLNINQPASQFLAKTKDSIFWLRQQFTLDSTLRNIPFSVLINQYGASEVYIDGQLTQRFGSISPKKLSVLIHITIQYLFG